MNQSAFVVPNSSIPRIPNAESFEWDAGHLFLTIEGERQFDPLQS